MKNKFLYSLFAVLFISTVFTGCKRDLTVVPNDFLVPDDIYTDEVLIRSVLSQFYLQSMGPTRPNQNGWGQQNDDWNKYQQDPDDALNNNGGISSSNLTWGRDRYKMDLGQDAYPIIRRINQFLAGIRSDKSKAAMAAIDNSRYEGEALFLRAYIYFQAVKTLGGISIVNDEVFSYAPGSDIIPLQKPRDSEAACYQYIIDECDKAAAKFNNDNGLAGTQAVANLNRSLANKWACKMLKARAALYAASIAKWTTVRAPGQVKMDNSNTMVVGIPASMADNFYQQAFTAAKDVIDNSGYSIMTSATNPELAFYSATTLKSGNTEVIWSFDRKTPQVTTQLTRYDAPVSHSDQADGNALGVTLNLVESFENRDGSSPIIKTKLNNENAAVNAVSNPYIIYNDVEEPFKAKDARLWGTAYWPNSLYRGTPIVLKAGEMRKSTAPYNNPVFVTVAPPIKGTTGTITSQNGPADVGTNNINKTGFGVRKFLDETPNSGAAASYSDVWWPRFRLAESYIIACEAAFFLPSQGAGVAVGYINVLRARGKIQPLTAGTLTFDKIMNENRVEFAFEDHRVWDLIRWRMAHVVWNGIGDDILVNPTSVASQFTLYPYQIVNAADPNNGKWVFTKQKSYRRQNTPFLFEIGSYYSTITQSYVTQNNPNWVLNPGQ